MSVKKIYEGYYSFVSKEMIFVMLSFLVNAFFILYLLGFLKNKNIWIETISFYLKMFIGIFLVLKFNPFYSFTQFENKFTTFDKRVVFSAGVYILIINFIVFYNHITTNAKAEPAKAPPIDNELLVPFRLKRTD